MHSASAASVYEAAFVPFNSSDSLKIIGTSNVVGFPCLFVWSLDLLTVGTACTSSLGKKNENRKDPRGHTFPIVAPARLGGLGKAVVNHSFFGRL